MESLTDLHRRTLAATGRIVAGIRPEQWTTSTPCEGWDVRYLTEHLVGGNLWAAELGAGKTIAEVGTTLDGDLLQDDPLAAYRRSADAAATAFEAPGALDAPCAVSYGPVPGRVYAGHRIIDVFVHGWDLAVSTGQDARLDPELVAACTEIVEPQLDDLRASGAFGPPIPVPADGNAQTQLLSWLGRDPRVSSGPTVDQGPRS